MKTRIKKLTAKKALVIGPVLAAILGVGVLTACTDNGIMESRDSNGVTTSQEISGREGGSERGGGEHGSGGESGNESGASGSEEGSGANLAPDATFDAVRGGARLILNYDAAGNAFTGTVENTTGSALSNVRIEVHLSNGTELGPTTPIALAPGETANVNLPSTQASFTGWIAHAEVGSGAESASEGSGGESGSEGGGSGSEEGSGANLAPDATFDAIRGGARLIMNYDAAGNAFTGTVENTTANALSNVRIEVHLSNGTELGPTTPIALAPGETANVNLPSTQASFASWIAHAEVGSGAESASEGSGGESGSEGGESGPDGPEGSESGSEAAREAAMSSPITPLDQTWNGVLGGLAISAQYDAATQSVNSTVQNTTSQQLCYVQAEPHLKSGTQTVGELGPQKLGDLNPGQTVTSSLSVSGEPELAGVAFDGYVVHMEVFDCGGPGPAAHTGAAGAEGSGGEGAGGEGHGPGGEGGSESGGESGGSGSEEGSGAMLAQNEIFDAVRGGARLVMGYDAASNAFNGIVENTTANTLSNVRIEVHLSNGTELGPTTPVDMAPGEMYAIKMPATQVSFTGWIAHAEVGGGEGGGEHGSGSGSGEGSESGGEHGSSRESGGEHGGRGERRGGG